MVWTPRVTVAAVIERDGAFLMVEEHTEGGLRLSQPAGHLEPGESIVAAAIRETLEETGHQLQPIGWLGTDLWTVGGESPYSGTTYLRFNFVGTVTGPVAGFVLDADIKRAFCITAEALRARPGEHRSPLVMKCIDNYLEVRDSGRGWLPLEAFHTHSVVLDLNHGK